MQTANGKRTHTHTLASQQTVVGKEQYHPHEQLTLNGLLRPSFHRYICSSNGSTKKTMIRVYIYIDTYVRVLDILS